MLREHLTSRSVAVPDASADARAVNAYRAEVERWFRDPLRQRRMRQPITWTIEILEVSVASNSSVREFDIEAYSLNADGARVGGWYRIRCPASAVPRLNPLDAKGIWVLKGCPLRPRVPGPTHRRSGRGTPSRRRWSARCGSW
jgi:hypothetical protein